MWVGGLGREGGKHGFALDFASVVHCMHTRQETSIGKVVPSGPVCMDGEEGECSRPSDCGGHSWHHSEQSAPVFFRNDVL